MQETNEEAECAQTNHEVTYPGDAGETNEEAECAQTNHEVTALPNFVEDVRESVNDGRVYCVDNSKLKRSKHAHQ